MVHFRNRVLLIISFILSVFSTFAQRTTREEIKNKFVKADTNQALVLIELAEQYQSTKPDSALIAAQAALTISEQLKYAKGTARSLDLIASAFNIVGNYPKALEYYILSLKIEEQRNRPRNLAVALMNIGTVYLHQKDYRMALSYTFSADSVLVARKVPAMRKYALLNIGDIYEKFNKLDSARDYTNAAYYLALQEDDLNMSGTALNNIGNISYRLGQYEFALKTYRQALPLLIQTNDEDFVCETSIGLAKTFTALNKNDSALYYGRRAYALARQDGFLRRIQESSSFLTNYFEGIKNFDSAYEYQRVLMATKDSLNSIEHIRKAQLLTFNEQQRQTEIANSKIKEAYDLKQRLQFIGIGVLIPNIFILSFYLRKRKVKPKIIEFLGLVSVLMFFEYITLLLHPIVQNLTYHVPLFELIVFSIIAAILTRIHHTVEHWFLTKINSKKMNAHH